MKPSAREFSSIMQLLDQALELPEEERLSWVDTLPDVYENLKPTLRDMFGSSGAGGVLARLEGHLGKLRLDAFRNAERVELASGSRVGPYELERILGQGGMGTVWLARRADGAYQRQVALKLPHVTWMGDMSARLARERDILASLQHENIARFFDAGLDAEGRPYLAMEYIVGKPIDVHCREQGLSVRARTELILEVAKAVAHAHSKLIVHRDLKPNNILVTPEGGVRLLDFGVAMLLDAEGAPQARLTQVGGRALTIDYASPEQIRDESIGTASDGYSLGVIAFELLTGERPYRLKSSTAADLIQAIAEVEPRAASSAASDPEVRRQLRGDWDSILSKAMKKDPAERYATMAAFGEDLARYLGRLPVQARADGFLYRLRKFVARNSLQVAAATLVLIAVLIGSGVALWQAHIAREQAARAERVKDFILSIFNAADSATRKTTALELLQAAHQRILVELADQPRAEVELLTAVGYSMLGLDDLKEANQPLQDAVRIGTERLGATDAATIQAKVSLGEAFAVLGKEDEAEQVLEPAIATLRKRNDPISLVRALQWLSEVRENQGKTAEGADLAGELLKLADAHGDVMGKRELSEIYTSVAVALRSAIRPGAVDAARKAYESAQAAYGNPKARAVINGRSLYNNLLIDEGDLQLAKRELAEVIVQIKEVTDSAPTNDLALANVALGRAQAATGEKLAALNSFQSGLDIIGKLSDRRLSRATGIIRYNMGMALLDVHDFSAAEKALLDATTNLSAALGDTNPETANARSAHAVALAKLGRFPEADAELANILGKLSESQRQSTTIRSRVGQVRAAEKRYAEAQPDLEYAVKELGADSRGNGSKLSLAAASMALADVLIARRNGPEAVRVMDRAIEKLQSIQPDGSPELNAARELRGAAAGATP